MFCLLAILTPSNVPWPRNNESMKGSCDRWNTSNFLQTASYSILIWRTHHLLIIAVPMRISQSPVNYGWKGPAITGDFLDDALRFLFLCSTQSKSPSRAKSLKNHWESRKLFENSIFWTQDSGPWFSVFSVIFAAIFVTVNQCVAKPSPPVRITKKALWKLVVTYGVQAGVQCV